jgi:hypothetical protein
MALHSECKCMKVFEAALGTQVHGWDQSTKPHTPKHQPDRSCPTASDNQHAEHAPHHPGQTATNRNDKHKKGSYTTAQQGKTLMTHQ